MTGAFPCVTGGVRPQQDKQGSALMAGQLHFDAQEPNWQSDYLLSRKISIGSVWGARFSQALFTRPLAAFFEDKPTPPVFHASFVDGDEILFHSPMVRSQFLCSWRPPSRALASPTVLLCALACNLPP